MQAILNGRTCRVPVVDRSNTSVFSVRSVVFMCVARSLDHGYRGYYFGEVNNMTSVQDAVFQQIVACSWCQPQTDRSF
jgi:hypothetical protein